MISNSRAAFAALVVIVLTASFGFAQTAVTGFVLDSSGAPVAGAVVTTDGGPPIETRSADDGRFTLAGAGAGARLRVSAPGFATTTVRFAEDRTEPLRVVLAPAPLAESVTVTGSRGVTALETPAATTVVTSAELVNSAAGTLDDALRNTPGFTLFRRSSSRVANPTTQGVTLRGVSGSGASRTLVLADGLPLNDPFGSWVYWNRVPQAAIDRIEVVRGATGDLYGADALGGVIQVLTLAPTALRIRAFTDVGSKDTTRASLFGGGRSRGWSVSGSAEVVRTGGVFIVAQRDRGAADRRANSEYGTGYVSAGYTNGAWRGLAKVSLYEEDRGNGTAVQVNATDWRQVSGEVGGPALGGVWLARAAGGTQDYYQTFSAVAVNRQTERLTTEQQTPSTFSTYLGQWTRAWRSLVVLAGAEGKRIETKGSEIRYSLTNVPSGPFPFGGTEMDASAFGRMSVAVSANLTIAGGARVDGWKSDPLDRTLPEKSVTFFSPRASLSWRRGDVALQGSAYRAHRTPTLNELHRGFRVGNVNTNPNPLLEPERLTGFEGGVLVTRRRASARATVFWNNLDEAIANISLTPTTRERQNADTIHAGGVEIEADVRPTPALTVSGLAVFTSSRFRNEIKQPQLEGKRVPQVAKYQLGGGIVYAPAAFTVNAQARVIGPQFEDDLNTLALDRYAVVDVSASRTITRMVTAVFAIENLLDEEYAVGRTPVATVPPSTLTTIGWPRTFRLGVRVFLP